MFYLITSYIARKGLWGSLVSFQLRELVTPVQIRTDPLIVLSKQFHSILPLYVTSMVGNAKKNENGKRITHLRFLENEDVRSWHENLRA